MRLKTGVKNMFSWEFTGIRTRVLSIFIETKEVENNDVVSGDFN